ncbi:highly divergent homeobox isoform X2 [Erpetoichthys calabaricus]|nr:highly divergent homeobox isoform X2 [Erpetoichthys calabaricus]XP_028671795.1 highly divergent homeobox isoform X2 [Erpetoichthys calabaricus]
MNLRSVFTAEQQRILQRYYENGMTNQSKSCFQLILQCAQEAKLDFSVVRTWVGNKRRKLTSKMEQNGSPQSSSNSSGGNGSTTGSSGTVMVVDSPVRNAAVGPRWTQQAQVLPATSSSSSSSNSSGNNSSSNNNNNNNDVIVMGVYTLAPPSGRTDTASSSNSNTNKTTVKVVGRSETESQQQPPPAHSTQLKTASPVNSFTVKTAPYPRKVTQPSSTNSVYCNIKNSLIMSGSQTGDQGGASRGSWTRPYSQQQWPFPSEQQPSNSSARVQEPSSCPAGNVKIQQVFTLAPGGGEHQAAKFLGQTSTAQTQQTNKARLAESMGCFSIAMETGDADDEYAREEELANMGAQMQICPSGVAEPGALRQRDSPGVLPAGRGGGGLVTPQQGNCGSSELSPTGVYPANRDYQSPSTSTHYPSGPGPFYNSSGGNGGAGVGMHRSNYSTKFHPVANNHNSPQRMGNYQLSGNLTVPWITSNSRKRTLQDRTQFSDRDLATLKKFWDNGMTSLGSVCREKITAVAAELNVDCEIIKTWIGNRRRKYRLMGIEIPPPKGGPADFTDLPDAGSPGELTPGGDNSKTSDQADDSDRNDEVSICLSEDGASDAYQREDGEDGDGEVNNAALADNVKIEIIDDQEEDTSASDLEQVQTLLEFKHEEVKYLETELENQKQKYYELQTFAKNLVAAVKMNNTEQQQELLSNIPQEVEDWDFSNVSTETNEPMIMIQSYSSASEEKGAPESL